MTSFLPERDNITFVYMPSRGLSSVAELYVRYLLRLRQVWKLNLQFTEHLICKCSNYVLTWLCLRLRLPFSIED